MKIFPSSKVKKLGLLHFIETNKNIYFVYEVQPEDGSFVYIRIEKNDKHILKKEVLDESSECYGGTSFDNIVKRCLNHLRVYIKTNNEIIIDDHKIKKP